MTFTELLGNVGLFGGAVMLCLAVLSLFSVGLIVDKHRRFRTASRQSQAFKPVFGKFLHGGELQELIDAVQQHQNSHVAQVVSAGILEYDGVRQAGGDPVASLELVTSALRDSMSETLVQLKRGLGIPGHDRLHGSVHRPLRHRGRNHQRVPEHRGHGVRRNVCGVGRHR